MGDVWCYISIFVQSWKVQPSFFQLLTIKFILFEWHWLLRSVLFVCSLHLEHLIWKNNRNCVKHGHDDFLCLFCLCNAQLDPKFRRQEQEWEPKMEKDVSQTIDNKTKRWKRFALIAFQRFSSIKYTNLFRLLFYHYCLFVCILHILHSSIELSSVPPHLLQLASNIAKPRWNFHFIISHRYLCVLTTLYCVFSIWFAPILVRESVAIRMSYAKEFDILKWVQFVLCTVLTRWTNNGTHTHIPNANILLVYTKKKNQLQRMGKFEAIFQTANITYL